MAGKLTACIFFDPRDAAYFPSQLYYAHALSPAAREGHPALAGRDPRSMEVYTRVFALDVRLPQASSFTGDGRDAAEILRSLPRPAERLARSHDVLYSANTGIQGAERIQPSPAPAFSPSC